MLVSILSYLYYKRTRATNYLTLNHGFPFISLSQPDIVLSRATVTLPSLLSYSSVDLNQTVLLKATEGVFWEEVTNSNQSEARL